MMIVSKVFFPVLLLVQHAQSCVISTGDTFGGTYPDAANAKPTNCKGKATTLTFGGSRSGGRGVVEHCPAATFFSVWDVAADGNSVKTNDLAAKPPDFACASSQVSNYNLNWAGDCKSFTLSVSSDPCGPRMSSYQSLTLTKVTTPGTNGAQCGTASSGPFPQGLVLAGTYPAKGGDPDLSGEAVTFSFGAGGWATETSSVALFFVQWQRSGSNVQTSDVVSDPSKFACPSSTQSSYAATFASDKQCAVALALGSDACQERRRVYNGLKLTDALSGGGDDSGPTIGPGEMVGIVLAGVIGVGICTFLIYRAVGTYAPASGGAADAAAVTLPTPGSFRGKSSASSHAVVVQQPAMARAPLATPVVQAAPVVQPQRVEFVRPHAQSYRGDDFNNLGKKKKTKKKKKKKEFMTRPTTGSAAGDDLEGVGAPPHI